MSVDGVWTLTMNTPMGKQEAKLSLATAGDQFTGNLSSPMGSAEVQEGKVSGDAATWKCSLKQPMPATLEFTAKFSGDSLTGEVKLGMFGKSSFTGVRGG